MEIKGKVKVIGAEQQVNASFKKRELVINTESQYPESILIEFVQDKTDLLNNLVIGQQVKVHINLGGREWVNPVGETKYFNSIKGWRVETISEAPKHTSQPDSQVPDTNEMPF
jgi:hypothetical protein